MTSRAIINGRTAVPLLFLLVIALNAWQCAAADHGGPRQHGAHVHGTAQLNVAVDGANVLVELLSPAINIVGFEHLPSTDDQRRTIHEAAERLEDGGSLFAFSKEADCTLVSAETDFPLLARDEAHHTHDDSRKDQDQAGESADANHQHVTAEEHEVQEHSEFEARYQFSCEEPKKLKSLTVNLFSAFPAFDKIEAQMLTSNGQSGAELTARNNRLNL